MQKNHLMFALAILFLGIALSACGGITAEESKPTEEIILVEPTSQPVDTQSDEARVRYILADAQLGDVIDYYRQFADDPAVFDALDRWDWGVRVVNLGDFERIINGDAGWQVVYTGTNTLIDGMDVILTTDTEPVAETPSTSQNPTGDLCYNPWWPVIPGTTYVRAYTEGAVDTLELSSISDVGRVYFQLAGTAYECWEGSIMNSITGLVLPAELGEPGTMINETLGYDGIQSIETQMGTYDAAHLCQFNVDGITCYDFVYGLGPVRVITEGSSGNFLWEAYSITAP
jgi:hypothetical protein